MSALLFSARSNPWVRFRYDLRDLGTSSIATADGTTQSLGGPVWTLKNDDGGGGGWLTSIDLIQGVGLQMVFNAGNSAFDLNSATTWPRFWINALDLIGGAGSPADILGTGGLSASVPVRFAASVSKNSAANTELATLAVNSGVGATGSGGGIGIGYLGGDPSGRQWYRQQGGALTSQAGFGGTALDALMLESMGGIRAKGYWGNKDAADNPPGMAFGDWDDDDRSAVLNNISAANSENGSANRTLQFGGETNNVAGTLVVTYEILEVWWVPNFGIY